MTLRAGAASRDITPELRGDFFGYVRPDLRARGVAIRLHAHALVLDDGDRRIGLVTLDLGAPLVADEVFDRVADLGFDRSNLLVAATHTHAGPNRPGAVVVDQVEAALRAATAALTTATATWGRAPLTRINRNRSIEAHLANHGLDLHPGAGRPELDPAGEDHPRDVELRLLRVTSRAGRPIAAWGHFSVHPTTFVPANTLFSADVPGVATRAFRAAMGPDAPVAILTNGTEGDLIPRYDEVNQHACADRIGRRTTDAMLAAWDDAASGTPVHLVAGATREIRYAGQQLEPGVRVGHRAWFGLPFVGGAVNGPSLLYGLGLEGRRRPTWLASRVHGRKLRLVPAPWPPRADVTVLRVGDRLLLGVPGEPTVEAGRRMCAAALDAASSAGSTPAGVAPDPPPSEAMVVGLAQAYRGYFTTPEEYDQQHYEGGHTVFGKHTSRLVEHAHAELAAALDTPAALPPGGRSAPDAATLAGRSPRLGRGARRLRVTRQPPARAERLRLVTFGWAAARRGRDRPIDAPYVRLERLLPDGGATSVDDDLGGGSLVWRQRGRRVTAACELPADLPLGRYQFRVTGIRAEVVTRDLEVVASRGLVVRGAEVLDGELYLHTQQPAPDPVTSLRARERHPDGGRLRVEVADTEHVAGPDGAGRYRVPARDLPDPPPATVRVGDGALCDRHGNTSGAGRILRVGDVEELRWPPDLDPGGGRSPGPFGAGPRGRPRPWP